MNANDEDEDYTDKIIDDIIERWDDESLDSECEGIEGEKV